MALTVNFRTQVGNVRKRQFPKNTGVSVYGKATGVTGIGEPGTLVRMEIYDENNNSIFFDEDTTDIWGDYDFWFRTPNEDTRLTIVLTATYSIAGQDNVQIPIAVGNVFALPAPIPEAEGSWLNMIPMIAIAAGMIYLIKLIND